MWIATEIDELPHSTNLITNKFVKMYYNIKCETNDLVIPSFTNCSKMTKHGQNVLNQYICIMIYWMFDYSYECE